MHLSAMMDLDALEQLIGIGMIDRKESDDGRVLYDYTHRAQFSGMWTPETTQCRGLVTDTSGKVLARPFPKFWNLAEHASPNLPDIPDEPFEVLDKLDGSLIIVYRYQGRVCANTRGSFTSDQAIAALEWLLSPQSPAFDVRLDETWLFEWIAPDNRIVVNYGDRRECVLLDVIDNESGGSLLANRKHAFTVPEKIDAADLDALPERDNAEGYVVKFEGGMRVKVKHPRYVAIHRALSGLNEHRVWEMLRDGVPFDDLYEVLPDESYEWLKYTESLFRLRLVAHGLSATQEFGRVMGAAPLATDNHRKAFALEALKSPYRAILFAMLDKKPYDHLIWKMIEPKGGEIGQTDSN